MARTDTRHTWVPYVAAFAGAILVLKVALVIGTDNRALDGPMGGVSHLGGVLLGLVAAIGVGLRRDSLGRRIGVGFGMALLFIAWVMGLGDLLEPVIAVFSDAEHVGDEVPIGVAGIALLIGAYVGWSNDQVGTTSTRTPLSA